MVKIRLSCKEIMIIAPNTRQNWILNQIEIWFIGEALTLLNDV